MDYWLWDNLVDAGGATITVQTGGSSGDLVPDNLKDPRVGKPWRADAMPSEIRIQLAAATQLHCLGLFGVNLSELASCTLRLGTTAGASNVINQVVPLTGSQFVMLNLDANTRLPANWTSARHITIAATGSVPITIGRVWAGRVGWSTLIGHAPGASSWAVNDLSVRDFTARSGAVLADRAARLRQFTASYNALQPTEYQDLLPGWDLRFGLTRQVLFIPEPLVYPIETWPILGYMRELNETTFTGFLRAARDYTIIEAG